MQLQSISTSSVFEWLPVIVVVIVVLLLLVIALPLTIAFRIFKNYQKTKHIKGTWQVLFAPFKIPFLAPLFYFGNWEQATQAIHELGENGMLRVSYARNNSILISNRNLIREIFVTKQASFEKPALEYDMFNLFGENILSALSTEAWKRHHKVCYPAFSIDHLKYMCEEVVHCTDLFFDKVWNERMKKSHVTPQSNHSCMLDLDDFSMITIEVLGRSGFGISFGVFDELDRSGREFHDAVDKIFGSGLNLIILRRFFSRTLLEKPLMKYCGMDHAVSVVNRVLDQCIEQRKKELETNFDSFSKRDILSLMVKANMEENSLSNLELKSNALIFTLAGEETTSTTLLWVTYELAKNPDIQEKARKEIETLLPNQQFPTSDDYEKLHHVNAIILESLRRHPPVFSVLKTPTKDVMIGDKLIPKGSLIDACIYGIHMDEQLWPNPYKFDPERFMDLEFRNKAQHDFSFMPFSMSLRKCIGFKFAQMEACMVLSRLLQFYRFELLNDESNEEDRVTLSSGITVRPQNLRVKIYPILK